MRNLISNHEILTLAIRLEFSFLFEENRVPLKSPTRHQGLSINLSRSFNLIKKSYLPYFFEEPYIQVIHHLLRSCLFFIISKRNYHVYMFAFRKCHFSKLQPFHQPFQVIDWKSSSYSISPKRREAVPIKGGFFVSWIIIISGLTFLKISLMEASSFGYPNLWHSMKWSHLEG